MLKNKKEREEYLRSEDSWYSLYSIDKLKITYYSLGGGNSIYRRLSTEKHSSCTRPILQINYYVWDDKLECLEQVSFTELLDIIRKI